MFCFLSLAKFLSYYSWLRLHVDLVRLKDKVVGFYPGILFNKCLCPIFVHVNDQLSLHAVTALHTFPMQVLIHAPETIETIGCQVYSLYLYMYKSSSFILVLWSPLLFKLNPVLFHFYTPVWKTGRIMLSHCTGGQAGVCKMVSAQYLIFDVSSPNLVHRSTK